VFAIIPHIPDKPLQVQERTFRCKHIVIPDTWTRVTRVQTKKPTPGSRVTCKEYVKTVYSVMGRNYLHCHVVTRQRRRPRAQRSIFLETEIVYNRTCRVGSDPKSVNGDNLPHINFQQVMSPYPTTAHPSHPTFQVPGQAKCVASRKLRSSSSSTSVRVSKSTLITINTVRNSKSVLINNSTSTAPQDLNKQTIRTAVALRSQLQQ
jgi:hypothetical protein